MLLTWRWPNSWATDKPRPDQGGTASLVSKSEPAEICLATAALQQDLNQLLDFTLKRLKPGDKYTCEVIGQTDCSPLRTKNWGREKKKLKDKNPFIAWMFPHLRESREGKGSDFFCSDSRNKPHLGRRRRERKKKKEKKKSSLVQVQCSKIQLGAPSSVCGVNSRAQGPGDKNKRRNKWKIPKNETRKIDGSCEKRPPRPPPSPSPHAGVGGWLEASYVCCCRWLIDHQREHIYTHTHRLNANESSYILCLNCWATVLSRLEIKILKRFSFSDNWSFLFEICTY